MSIDESWVGKFGEGFDVTLRLMALSRDWVGILSQRREILWANPAWAAGLGLPMEQIIGRIFDDLIHPTETTLSTFDTTTTDTPLLEFNLALRDYRGDAVHVHWRLFRHGDQQYLNGNPFTPTAPKPTDPYRATFESAPLGIVHVGLDGHWLRVNRRFYELLGYSEAELRDLTFRDLTLPEDMLHYSELMLRLVTGETTHEETDCIHRHKDGSHHWMHMTGTLIRDERNAPDYFILTLEDSQARHDMEAALRQNQMRYRMVADYTYDWEFWQRPDKRYEYISPAVERITGYTSAEFMANHRLLEQIIVPEDLPRWLTHLREDEAMPPQRSLQFRLQHKSGEIRWVEHICAPIFEDGHYLGRRASNRDITERKQRQAELDDQRHLLESVFQAAPGYFYILDADTGQHILSNHPLNGPLAEMDRPITANKIMALMHPDDLAGLPDHRTQENQLPEGVSHTFEFRITDGVDGWAWIRATEVVFKRHPDGSIHQILGIANDITVEKEQEQALRASEIRFRHMFERHQAIKLLIDPQTGSIVDANPAAAKFYGWDVPTLQTMRIQDLNTLPDDQVRAEMTRAAAEQRDFFNFRHRLANGDIRDVEVHSAPIEVGGKMILYSIIMDVTALHETQRALQISQNRFDAFMKNSPMAAYIKDLEGRLVYINPVCARIFGLENVAWQNRTDLTLWGQSAAPPDADKRTLAMGMTTIAETVVMIGGEERVWLTHTFPIQDIEGHLFVGGMGVDITNLKRAEKQLIEMALERERMQILGHFIEKAAHEFRTPLSIIELGLYAIRGIDNTERHVRRVSQMEEQVFYIVKLVESMVMMTHLDSMTHVNAVKIPLQSLLHTIQEKFTLSYPERAAQLNFVLPETPLTLTGDAVLLERAISELLTNAHRFTPAEGQITLTARVENQRVVIAVQDTGVGIALEHQRHIFEHFYRVDIAHTTRGFGLGLSIVKRIVELHGGEIWVESTPGVGSTFSIVLPYVEKAEQ